MEHHFILDDYVAPPHRRLEDGRLIARTLGPVVPDQVEKLLVVETVVQLGTMIHTVPSEASPEHGIHENVPSRLEAIRNDAGRRGNDFFWTREVL